MKWKFSTNRKVLEKKFSFLQMKSFGKKFQPQPTAGESSTLWGIFGWYIGIKVTKLLRSTEILSISLWHNNRSVRIWPSRFLSFIRTFSYCFSSILKITEFWTLWAFAILHLANVYESITIQSSQKIKIQLLKTIKGIPKFSHISDERVSGYLS